MNDLFRQAKRLVDGAYVPVEFMALKPGDRFQLFERGSLLAQGIVETAPVGCDPPGNLRFGAILVKD
jgi:hypothetical protein